VALGARAQDGDVTLTVRLPRKQALLVIAG
jgi:hypothetical protein